MTQARNPTVLDVAEHIIRETADRQRLTTMKLQKLCYYSQAWCLAWTGEALFQEDFEAWAMGPVCPALFREHRGMFVATNIADADPDRIGAEGKAVIQDVLHDYARLTAQQLSVLTHREDPWLMARNGVTEGWSRAVIPKEVMRDFYSGLEMDSRATPVSSLSDADMEWRG